MYPNPLCDTIRNSSVPPAYMLSQHLEEFEFGRCTCRRSRSCSPRSSSACANLSVHPQPSSSCPCLTDASKQRR